MSQTQDSRAALAALLSLAREACVGARVLDLSPDGKDTEALLVEWGARSVHTPAGALGEEPVPPRAFGLVLALGEGPRDDRALLEAAGSALAPGGVAIVRFPVPPGGGREEARRTAALAREVMGAPTQVLVAMPVTGVALVDSEARRLDPVAGPSEREDIYCAARVAGGEGRIEKARDLVMVWGASLPEATAVAYAPDPAPCKPGFLARLLRRRGRPAGPGA